MASEVEVAWAAGLFEGEGSIRYYRDQISLKLGMTDRDVVERFAAVADCGRIRTAKQAQPHHKPFFEWSVNRQADCHAVMERLLPFLGERRTGRWLEVLSLRAAKFAPKVCPECRETFVPIRQSQVCCGHQCSWKHSARVGKYTDRAHHTATVERGGYTRPDIARRARVNEYSNL